MNVRPPEYLITDCCWAGSRRSGTRSAGRQMHQNVDDVTDELYVGRDAFDVESAPLNKLIIIIIICPPAQSRGREN